MAIASPLRISYNGKGGEFFVLLIKNFFLVMITLGIYNFWARVNAQRYMYEHATLAGGRFGWHAQGGTDRKGPEHSETHQEQPAQAG